MRLLVCGNRDADGEAWELTISSWLLAMTRVCRRIGTGVTLIHGAAPGADTLAAEAARRLGWIVDPYPADWYPNNIFDPEAGPRRNQQMLDDGHPDRCLAFGLLFKPDKRRPGRLCKTGTCDMVDRANRAGLLVTVVPHAGVVP